MCVRIESRLIRFDPHSNRSHTTSCSSVSATLADLKVRELVNETSAAALAYAFEREGPKTVLMVDVGGGGGSVSVVWVPEEGSVLVLASSGLRLPGGDAFDQRMTSYLKEVRIHTEQKTTAIKTPKTGISFKIQVQTFLAIKSRFCLWIHVRPGLPLGH